MELPKVPLNSILYMAKAKTTPLNLWAGRQLQENSYPVRD